MFPVLNSSEARYLDSLLSEKDGFSTDLLMERAGSAVARLIDKILKNDKGKRIVVWCGPGNNGGDGLVAARYLLDNGYKNIKVILLGYTNKRTLLVVENLRRLISRGFQVLAFEEEIPQNIEDITIKADLVVDALLGVGIKGEVKDPFSSVISIINQAEGSILAVDIPSGIDADTGKILGNAIEADFTIAMMTLKRGLVFYPGRKMAGQVFLNKLEVVIPDEKFDTYLLTEDQLNLFLPVRLETAHKGDFGRMLMISGSYSYQGAPVFVALGFFKVGGGYLYALIPQIAAKNLVSWVPEVVLTEETTLPDYLIIDDYDIADKYFHLAQVIAVGPGIGRKEDTLKLIQKVIKNSNLPIVIDGDGLLVLKENLKILKERISPVVITPHIGEFAWLLGDDIPSLKKKDYIDEVRKFSVEFGTVLVLKGSPTLIGTPSGTVFVSTVGTVGLATPGSGDVLTGMIAGFIGQGISVEKAALLSVYIHGVSSERLSKETEPRSFLARDIPFEIPTIMSDLRVGELTIIKDRFLKEV